MSIHTVSFGEHLKVRVEASGGLADVSRRLKDALGFLAPSRGTLQVLYRIDSVENLSDEQRFHAFLVLVAIGQDPERWMVTPVNVPAAIDMGRVSDLVRHQGLEPRTRWLRGPRDTMMRSRALLNDCPVR